MNTPLYKELLNYSKEIKHRLHMPGHKAIKDIYQTTGFSENILDIDLTEIEGVDSLFHPKGGINEAQRLAAEVYKSKEAIFLAIGASVGILASIMSVVGRDDEIIVPRNGHRSVHNAVKLTGAKAVYLLPKNDPNTGIAMGITPQDVERAIIEHPKTKAVVVANPNFFGFCSDLKTITEIVHQYNKILIVDEACGSHFKFHQELPVSGIETGADLVVHGTHKNLPSLTQSGILHINSDQVDANRVKEYLMILQSSSPSYILLASLEIAIAIVMEKGEELFNQLYENSCWLRKELSKLEGINCLDSSSMEAFGIVAHDFSKIVINFNEANITSEEVDEILRKKYSIQNELAYDENIILTFTIADSKEVFQAVLSAFKEIIASSN